MQQVKVKVWLILIYLYIAGSSVKDNNILIVIYYHNVVILLI